MNQTKRLVAAALVTLANTLPAFAQSAAPTGMWQGTTSGDFIYVQGDGNCSVSGASINVAGTCSWNPSYSGGILTLTYWWVTDYANLYYNVTWIDQGQILVNSAEVFVRMQ